MNSTNKTAYEDNEEHIYDELLLVDLFIHAEVIRFRNKHKNADNAFKGLYITEQEVDELLQEKFIGSDWTERDLKDGGQYEELTNAISNLHRQIRQKINKSREQNVRLNLVELSQLYGLSPTEQDILCICLAPQFDSKYRKLFSYLQNDITRKNPSVELILNLACRSVREKIASRDYFSSQGPLFKNNILEFIKQPAEPEVPLISREVKVNDRIVSYLLDSNFVDDNLSKVTDFYKTNDTVQDLIIPPSIKSKLKNFISYYKNRNNNTNFIFTFFGAYGTGKREVAAAICNEIKMALIGVNLLALYNSDVLFEIGIDLILRESNLIPSAIYFYNTEFLFSESEADSYMKRYFIKVLDNNSLLTFITNENPLNLQGDFFKQKYVELELPIPDYIERKKIWNRNIEGLQLSKEINIKELAGKYNLTGGQIQDIISTAHTFALWRSPENVVIQEDDILEACRLHSNQNLNKLAQRIKPRRVWKDIILPPDIIEKLKEVVKMFTYKHIVYDEWEFDKKLSLGKGISVLFHGEPGTGKTMASEIIANAVDMDLYKIDISTIVSKYIGETEKNLYNIFKEAETSNAILFFDEADALFGKRTEVKDSHDRYANIEVSYLLQKIEEYNGIVIMATNFSQNIDNAFERRLHFSIHFPFPEEKARLQIWQTIFPGKIPISDTINFTLLAKNLEISGGYIKNIALQAAFHAAESEGIVTWEHLIKAAKNEYEKIGRLWDNLPGRLE